MKALTYPRIENINEKYDTRFDERMMKMRKIKPNKYVWHLSYPTKRLSIAKDGLIPRSKDYANFANNQDHSIRLMWPIPIDVYDIDYRTDDLWHEDYMKFLGSYDYWRIDTTAFKADWYVDPNMYNDRKGYGCQSVKHYICTKSTIPAHALRLFKHYENKIPCKFGNGAAHCTALDFAFKPMENINEWIKFNNRNILKHVV